MGWLTDWAADLAPKLIKATTLGGTKADRDVVKNSVSNPVFKPVYQKFGRDFETGVKIAGSIATVVAAGAGLPLGVGKSGALATAAMPGTSGPTSSAGNASATPSWVVPLAIVVGILLFGKKLLQLLR